MKVGRRKDPLYRDSYFVLPHLPSSYPLRPLFPHLGAKGAKNKGVQGGLPHPKSSTTGNQQTESLSPVLRCET